MLLRRWIGSAFVGAALLFTAAQTPSSAQQPPTALIRGTILAADQQTITVRTKDGRDVKVGLNEKTTVVGLESISLADVKPDAFIGVASVPEPDGSQKAVSVHLFPDAARGTNEGTRPYDVQPNSSMTNGAVAQKLARDSRTEITLKYNTGEKRVVVLAETPVVRFDPGRASELVPGAKVVVTVTSPQSDLPQALRVLVGRNGITPAL